MCQPDPKGPKGSTRSTQTPCSPLAHCIWAPFTEFKSTNDFSSLILPQISVFFIFFVAIKFVKNKNTKWERNRHRHRHRHRLRGGGEGGDIFTRGITSRGRTDWQSSLSPWWLSHGCSVTTNPSAQSTRFVNHF